MVGFIVLKKESTYICATCRKCMNAMKNYTYHLVAVLTVGIWGADLYFNESIDWARSFSTGNILASFPDSLYGHLAYFSPKTVCRQLER